MNRLYSWLTHKLGLTLEPHERDTLQGDHVELGVSSAQALRDVLSLVIRRQLQIWTDWRPWLTLFGVVVPLGFFLFQSSLAVGRELGGDGLSDWFVWSLSFAIALVFGIWSWTAGFVMGTLSSKSLLINGGFLLLVWIGVLAIYLTDPGFYRRLGVGAAGLPMGLATALLYHTAASAAPWVMGLVTGLRRCTPSRPAALILFALPALAVAWAAWFAASSTGPLQGLLVVAHGIALCWPAAWILVKSFRADGLRPGA